MNVDKYVNKLDKKNIIYITYIVFYIIEYRNKNKWRDLYEEIDNRELKDKYKKIDLTIIQEDHFESVNYIFENGKLDKKVD